MTDKNYTTETRVENYLGTTVTDGSLDNIILSVQQFIENYTNCNFKADSSASTRLFNGSGSQFLTIDDCIEVTKVERGDNRYADSFTEVSSDNYVLLPTNYSENNIPIYEIHLRYLRWTEGIKNHRITAKWGYSEDVPEDVKQAATTLVSEIYKSSDSVGGIISESIGDYSVKFDNEKKRKEVYSILNKYKKYFI